MTNIEISNIKSLIKKGQYILARKKIVRLINNEPSNLSYKNLLAFIYVNQKKYKDSIIVLNNIIKQSPNFIDAYINLGSIYNDLNQPQKAEDCFKQAISINSNHLLALNKLADVYDKQSKHKEASEIYSRLILDNPDNLEFLNDYSGNLIKLGNLNKAKKILNEILNLNSKHIGAIINLGVVYKNKKNIKKATQYFSLALKLKPNLSIAYYNLGTVYEDQRQFESAITHYKKTIKHNPTYVGAYYNLGCVLDKIGKTKDAISSYKKAINYDPKHIKAQYNLGINLLAIDDFKNGWKGYELRWGEDIKNHYEKLNIPKDKIWDGRKFKGSLIVHAEQGIGDEILFSSMFPDLLNHCTNLFISASDRLIGLFQRSFSKIKFIRKSKSFDLKNNSKHILAGSLGKFFRNSINDFKKNKDPWLVTSKSRLEEFKKCFHDSKKIKIGLAWKSIGIESEVRNIALYDIVGIFPKDNFEIINLQYGDIESDKNILEKKDNRKLICFDNLDYTNDFEGLAALICNCDLIVTIGGFTASLAGSLGKQSWVLPTARTNWPWHSNSDRTESLWFPNMKFFRQKSINEWRCVFDLIKTEVNLKYKL